MSSILLCKERSVSRNSWVIMFHIKIYWFLQMIIFNSSLKERECVFALEELRMVLHETFNLFYNIICCENSLPFFFHADKIKEGKRTKDEGE